MGAIKDFFSNLFGIGKAKKSATHLYTQMLNNLYPVFSDFGNDIYVSDIVKAAVHAIAEEVSKFSLTSVTLKNDPKQVLINKDAFNSLFSGRPNPLMIQKDFLYKTAYFLIVNNNAFIYPQYIERPIAGSELVVREYTGFYPLAPQKVTFKYEGIDIYIELDFGEYTFDMPYSDIIHLRHKFGANTFLGGDSNGTFDARGLLRSLKTMHIVEEGLPKSLEATLSMKGVFTMKTVAEVFKKTLTREEFEKQLIETKSGFLVNDLETDFTPVNLSPTAISKDILDFIEKQILYPFGVSVNILTGNYTDDQFNAFYQKCVEGIKVSIEQSFTSVLFTPRQLAFGNRIKAYDRIVQNLSMERRIKIVEMVRDSGLLSAEEQRELLGYEPDGRPTRVSLNFIDSNIANDYQLNDVNKKQKEEKNNNA